VEGGSVKDLAKYRFDKALSSLAVAKTLLASGDYGFALNRAYYAAFDAMRAVHAPEGFDSSKHSGVISHFNQEYVKTGKFPPGTSAIIRKASMLREKSDYEDFYEPEPEEAAETVAKVETFLRDTENYLRTAGIIE